MAKTTTTRTRRAPRKTKKASHDEMSALLHALAAGPGPDADADKDDGEDDGEL